MKKFVIPLEFPGIVLFDPILFSAFVSEQLAGETDVLGGFIRRPEIGDRAVAEGFILPIYQTEVDDYTVVLTTEHTIPPGHTLFRHEGFPLRIDSGWLVATDIHAIMDWDPGFFANYPSVHRTASAMSGHLEIPARLYGVTVTGYRMAREAGYEVCLQPAAALPRIDQDKSISDFDFRLAP